MSADTPQVSIGLAVYNGEKYLGEAIESILAQTFTDFELIISDNASTDRTAEICQRYAAQDTRIRYSRNATNIGGANNENLTFTLSRGEYFRWAAHDDVCAPELIEQCVDELENDPTIVLCHTQMIEIDENGAYIRQISRDTGKDDSPYKRFYKISKRDHGCEQIYGLIRSKILKTTRLQQNYSDSDRTLLCELALHGKFYEIPKPLFYKRLHPGNVYVDWRTRMAWFSSAYVGKIVFPHWMMFYDFLVTIRRVPLSLHDKTLCYLVLVGPVFIRYVKNLLKDVIVAFQMLLHSAEWRRKRYKNTSNWISE